jgi:hypothetical protein
LGWLGWLSLLSSERLETHRDLWRLVETSGDSERYIQIQMVKRGTMWSIDYEDCSSTGPGYLPACELSPQAISQKADYRVIFADIEDDYATGFVEMGRRYPIYEEGFR